MGGGGAKNSIGGAVVNCSASGQLGYCCHDRELVSVGCTSFVSTRIGRPILSSGVLIWNFSVVHFAAALFEDTGVCSANCDRVF